MPKHDLVIYICCQHFIKHQMLSVGLNPWKHAAIKCFQKEVFGGFSNRLLAAIFWWRKSCCEFNLCGARDAHRTWHSMKFELTIPPRSRHMTRRSFQNLPQKRDPSVDTISVHRVLHYLKKGRRARPPDLPRIGSNHPPTQPGFGVANTMQKDP